MQAFGNQPRPTRPGYGTVAHRSVELLANHFLVVCRLKQVSTSGLLPMILAHLCLLGMTTDMMRCSHLIHHRIATRQRDVTSWQAFHFDVAIAPVRRIPPETEKTSKSTQEEKAPRAPAKPLTPELAR